MRAILAVGVVMLLMLGMIATTLLSYGLALTGDMAEAKISAVATAALATALGSACK